jgi:hypothetical protein
MPKLSDSQITVLADACMRDDGCAFPITAKLKGNAAGNVLKSLLAKGLLHEVEADRDDTVWRHDEDKGSLTLCATPAAYAAIGIEEAGEGTLAEPAPAATRRDAGKKTRSGRAAGKKAAVKAPPADRKLRRAGTKQAELIAMLLRREGVTIEETIKALGWQPHTVRGAIAGALKKRLGLTITSEKVAGRGRVYRIGE